MVPQCVSRSRFDSAIDVDFAGAAAVAGRALAQQQVASLQRALDAAIEDLDLARANLASGHLPFATCQPSAPTTPAATNYSPFSHSSTLTQTPALPSAAHFRDACCQTASKDGAGSREGRETVSKPDSVSSGLGRKGDRKARRPCVGPRIMNAAGARVPRKAPAQWWRVARRPGSGCSSGSSRASADENAPQPCLSAKQPHSDKWVQELPGPHEPRMKPTCGKP